MKVLNERLLEVWLELSMAINNERVVSDVPFNESLICNILYRAQMQDPAGRLTATDLCNATRMLKSQMNRTLNSMEEKGFITRTRSEEDKRLVFVTLNPEKTLPYQEQHSKILELIDIIIEQMGEDKVLQTINLLTQISNIAREVLS
ncbi:MAG: MarR family transcriptional regulator [Lachnospiraceae bacterium]|nr:MarR family transcriptional regulator [Lachnospiraceae bacterium]